MANQYLNTASPKSQNVKTRDCLKTIFYDLKIKTLFQISITATNKSWNEKARWNWVLNKLFELLRGRFCLAENFKANKLESNVLSLRLSRVPKKSSVCGVALK